jgi:pimeloyl-ACP methyl ester carboxylesterase
MKLEVISVEAKGDARPTPVLFVHGAWHGAWCWRENFMPYFADRGYNTYALSLRGHGKSEGPKSINQARMADYVADVAEVASRLPKPPVVVGHSMGGAIVQKYLESHKAPAGVLLASCPAGNAIMPGLRIARAQPWTYLKACLLWNLYLLVATPEKVHHAGFSRDVPIEKVRKWQSQMGGESLLAFLDLFFFNYPNPGKISTDMLVLGAERDTIMSLAECKTQARVYKAERKMFPMAHYMPAEPGWEKVADCIIEWLKVKNL